MLIEMQMQSEWIYLIICVEEIWLLRLPGGLHKYKLMSLRL